MPHDLDCAAIQVLLLPMIHGRLTPVLDARIQDHLSTCPACKHEYDELLTVRRQVKTLIDQLPPAPDSLWSRLELATAPALERQSEAKTGSRELLSSCLNLLTSVGVPEWTTQLVTQSMNLTTTVRDSLLTPRLTRLLHPDIAAGSN